MQVDVLGLAHPGQGGGPNTHSTSGDVDGVDGPPDQAGRPAAKISEQGEWGAFDQDARENVASAILDNPVSAADYQRLNQDGVPVVLNLSDSPRTESGARIQGEYLPLGQNPGDPPTVVIYVRNNPNEQAVASTLSHEATHHDTHTQQPELRNTHADEYNSFRREFEFEHGREPNASEQQAIMRHVESTYPELDAAPSSWSIW